MLRLSQLGVLTALAPILLSSSANAANKPILAFVVNGKSDFWREAEAGVKKAQAELPAYDLKFIYPEIAAATVQQRILDNLVSAGAAGIIVSPIDPRNQTEALDAVASRAALYTADTDAPQSNRIAFIGSSQVDLGKQVGSLAQRFMPNGGKCVGFVGLKSAENARERIQGFKEATKGSGIQLVDVRDDEIDQGKAAQNVRDVFSAMPEVNCMVGFYSYNTPRIYQVLKEQSRLGFINVIGMDQDPITLAGVKEGFITGTVVQQPFLWGYGGMKSMARYVSGDKSRMPGNGLIIVPGKVIDKSNVDDFIAQMKQTLGE